MLSRSKTAVLTLALVTLLLGPNRVETAAPSTLQQALEVQVASALRVSSALGVHIVDLDTGETEYGYNPDDPRVAAAEDGFWSAFQRP